MNVDINLLKHLYEETSLTDAQIAEELGISVTWLYRGFLYDMYDREYRKMRKQRSYQLSKLGDKNPMKGKTKEQHPRYKERVSDGKGYWMVLKPDWYTGRKGCQHVFEHSVVMCKALGLTEIPEGYVVHHIDGDRHNNDIDNLALMTNSAHSKLHQQLRKCRDYGASQ